MTPAASFREPTPAQGREVLGRPLPEWPRLEWVQGGPLRMADLRGRVVLIRFFMDSRCPLCTETAPALNAFQREFGPRGLTVIGFYTPKPRPKRTPSREVREYVRSFRFTFPVAVDDEWRALLRLWLDRVPGASYTSASLLVDRKGVVRHVQPGGAYAEDSSDPAARRDYRAMHDAIVKLLNES